MWRRPNRTPINKVLRTIRFKDQYPDYTTFKLSIEQENPFVDLSKMDEPLFIRIRNMISNQYLRYDNGNMNSRLISAVYEEEIGLYMRSKAIYEANLKDMMARSQTAVTSAYEVNATEETASVEEDFLQRKNIANVIAQDPVISRLNEWMVLAGMPDPYLVMVKNIVNRIVLPYQPKEQEVL